MGFPAIRTVVCVAGLACLAVTGCSDDAISVVTPTKTTVLGEWVASVEQIADTCDNVLPPVLNLELEIEPWQDEHRVFFRNYGYGFDCWVMPIEIIDETHATMTFSYNSTMDCNPGCRVTYSTRLELTFTAGGRFDAIETIHYEPTTPECDVPECQLPCADSIDHLLWESRGTQGCGAVCQTTYRWQGLLVPEPTLQACGS